MLIGFLGSVALGLGIGFIQEAISNRISVQRHLEDLLQWPITTLIPHYNGRHPEQLPRICYDDPLSPLAEAFRFLRTDILLSATDRNLKTIMVVTAKPEEGGSLVAANLAISLAQDGKRVILVDADLRNPALHPVFKLPNQIGLAEVLKDERDLPEALANTEIDNLALIPAGTPPLNPAELLGSWRMRSTINSLKEVADFVVFDTPSALTYADSIVLSQMVDGVLLVIRAQQMAKSAELQMRNLLNKARARVLGVVLNDVSPDRIETFYYHSLGYSSGDEKKRLAAPEKMGSPPQLPEA
jgi:capsular exopolysaccharide synthesis family protein